MTFLIYCPDAVYDDGGALERAIGGEAIDFRVEKWRDQTSLNADLLRRADGVLAFDKVTLDAATIARLENCKIIVRSGTGYNNIDVPAASARGIPVCNTPDYGTAEDPDQFRALVAYSPVHNLKPGRCYPPTLVTTADHDDRVVPWHSFKFAAALQHAQACANPVLIRIETRAGHGAGKPTWMLVEDWANHWAFLTKVLDMPSGK